MVRQRDEIYNENYLDKFYVEDFHLEVKKHGLIFKIWNLKQIPRFSPDKALDELRGITIRRQL